MTNLFHQVQKQITNFDYLKTNIHYSINPSPKNFIKDQKETDYMNNDRKKNLSHFNMSINQNFLDYQIGKLKHSILPQLYGILSP